MKKTFLLLLQFLLIGFFVSILAAQTKAAFACSSNGTGGGSFNSASTWVDCNDTTPQPDDTIIINNADTVMLSATTTIAGININSGGILNSNTRTVINTGHYTNNGSQTGTNSTMTLSGSEGTLISGDGVYSPSGIVTISVGDKTIASDSNLSFARVTVTDVTLTNNSSAGFSVNTALSGTGTLVQGDGAVLNIKAASAITTLIANATGNTVYYNGSGGQPVKGVTYENLIIDKSGGTATLGGTTVVQSTGSLTIANGTLNLSTHDFTNNSNTSITGTLRDSSASGVDIFVGPILINPNGRWISPGDGDYSIQSGITFNGTTFNSGNGIYTFEGNSQSIEGLNDFTIDNIDVSGITLTNLNSSGLTITTSLSGSGTFTQGTNSILIIRGSTTINNLNAEASGNTVSYTSTNSAQDIRGTTYQNLTVAKNSRTGTLTDTTLVKANLSVTSGTLDDDGFILTVNGNSNMNGTHTGSGKILFADGLGVHTVAGSGSYGSIELDDPSGVVQSSTTNIDGDFTITNGTWTVTSNLSVDGDTSINDILSIESTAGSKNFNNIVIEDSGLMNFTAAEALNINGNLEVNGNGSITGTTGTLTFQKSGGGIISGTAENIEISDATFTTNYSLNIAADILDLRVNGAAVVTNNTILTVNDRLRGNGQLTQGTNSILNLGGDTTITTLDAGVDSNEVYYASTSDNQSIKPADYYHLFINKPGRVATASSIINVFGDLTVVEGTLRLDSSTVTVLGATDIFGTLSDPNNNGSGNFGNLVSVYAGGIWEVNQSSPFNFSNGFIFDGDTFISGNGTYTFLDNDQNIGGSEELSITDLVVDGVQLTNTNTETITLTSSLSGTGTFIQSIDSVLVLGGSNTVANFDASASGNEVKYNDNSFQTVHSGVYTILDVSENTNSQVDIFADVTINSLLNLGATNLSTGTSKVIISPGAILARSTGYIDGNLEKSIASGDSVLSFEVGSNDNYAPVEISIENVSSTGELTVRTTTGAHPNLSTSGFVTNTTINRYWTILNSGISFTSYSAVFNFTAGDIDPLADSTGFIVKKYDAGLWESLSLGAATDTSLEAVGLTAFSDFVIGNVLITNITSSESDGSYPLGDSISIQISFSDNAFVTGIPHLILNSGGTALYSSGSGTNTLAFIYEIEEGDSSNDLDYVSSGALILNGGTIQDISAEDLDLTLPTPGTSGSLGDNKNIIVDGNIPTFSNVLPISGSIINSVTIFSDVSYLLSKDLLNGTIAITRTGGFLDPSSPHICNLSGSALTAGTHIINFLDTINGCNPSISLVDGGVYSFVLSGTDLVGNIALPITVNNVGFEVDIAISISINPPIPQLFFNIGEGITPVDTITEPGIDLPAIQEQSEPALFDVTADPLELNSGSILPVIAIAFLSGGVLAAVFIVRKRNVWRSKIKNARVLKGNKISRINKYYGKSANKD
ncbi:MAG TPA: hypothetical protein VGA67_05490 [Candidatus Dojkabacteria bacterium]